MTAFADYNRDRAELERALNTTVEPLKLRPVEAYILYALLTDTCWRANDLARFCGYPATSFTRVLDALEKKGLICRTPDGNDRRVVNLQLTDAGRKLRAGVFKAVADMEAALVELWQGKMSEVAP